MTIEELDKDKALNEMTPNEGLCVCKSEVAVIKCPECLIACEQNELDMFGGLCEECSGAFDN